MDLKSKTMNRIRALTRRERVILLVLLGLLAVYGGDRVFADYLRQRSSLYEAVASAEQRIRHQNRLLGMEDWIHTEYRKLENPGAVVRDSVLTETAVLRQLADLAGQKIHVVSLVPRLMTQEGQGVMLVALDCVGTLEAVVEYVQAVLNELPSEVNSMTLSPQVGETESVTCRLSIRVEGCET